MALHTKLKEYRESKGLKQADLADLVHVRRETIVNLEKGKYNPSLNLAMDIANAVGFTTRCIGARELNHSWCIVKTTDTNGNNYWQGVFATSDGYNMNSGFNANKANYSKAYLSKYSYSPARSMIVSIKRPKNYVDLNPTTPTTPFAVTASAIKCPGCTGNIQHNAKNPYKTNKPFSYGNYGVWMYIHNGGGVIRLYDENGKEYPEVVELAKDILKNYF